jgi:tRNA pseudouridine(38-40) synthase
VREAVSVLDAVVVSEDWHARFSANERRYLYRILNRRAPPALEAGKVWHVKKPIDAEAMHAAAQALVGLHDFTTFRDMACQAKSPLKTLDVARVSRVGDEVHLVFEARSFLHRQVRSMTGTLAEVGVGRWTADDVRGAGGQGPHGLRAGGPGGWAVPDRGRVRGRVDPLSRASLRDSSPRGGASSTIATILPRRRGSGRWRVEAIS